MKEKSMEYADRDEIYTYPADERLDIGSHYFLANSAWRSIYLYYMSYNDSTGYAGDSGNGCLGIRPVVEMVDGVYIASGTGTEADPYILAKD